MVLNANHLQTKKTIKETLLAPRFYTTDFDEISRYDISSNFEEIEAIVNEFRSDYNKKHFIRDEEFDRHWSQIDAQTKQMFVEFLERSCTAEFSGFLLYKELARKLKEKMPVLAEGFLLMSRDEARHAGFLNKAMADFNLTLDLGFMTKNRRYTFFKPKFIFYATYLSEKIGYWRYITIYRHLEKHPEHRIYPIFKFFESWCQDENRHGDFFAAIVKSQPYLLEGFISKLWCRFFLLAVFATMYLNDCQRGEFYKSIGLDPRQFDIYVIQKTNESAAKLFPTVLDLDNPRFFECLDKCACYNKLLLEIDDREQPFFNQVLNVFYKFYLYFLLVLNFIMLYFLRTVNCNSFTRMVK
uniref:Magnesium-protoporphyrin IX monomethyl ester [oxidative] cyclase n=1 Tax=Cyanidium caldarium TaxID=2771 RepID=ACSF_CYACA|nr:magnesium-protoporphyrin IX monomethyl ester cyclase [Cyanidium caldarium]Q9TLR8.1 RecName: Full=Magnesium-protoporphyrin IX monomethyl ester [oxidative] cyclase; Short=Mg-protoporphyrin IX monomethyl ester oxidative cyclase [Cyanidium caldarium]AAF12893.1 unknown [Cyanidium caldarium]WDB00136.1 magnesium-protoporphyrin IX monomethyl ester cyclase [Cyanidium caldarium]